MRNCLSSTDALRSGRALRTFAVALVATLFAGTASAGVGIFGEYARGIPTSGGTIFSTPVITPGWASTNEITVGVAFDSNLARNKLLNSRTDLGFHVALPSGFPAGFPALGVPGGLTAAALGNGYGGQISYALGFGIVRSEAIRVWIGPDVRLNADWYGSTVGGSTTDFVNVQVGVGPRLGINLHTTDNTTLTLSGGYNYKWGWIAFPSSILSGTIDHRDHVVNVNLAFFWRGGGDIFE